MKILIITLSLCVLPVLASSSPCAAGSYSSYEALSSGCSIGDATFSNFSSLSFVNSPGVTPLNADEIEVIPTGIPTDASLTFVYLNANGADAPITLSSNGQIFSFGLNFQILVTPGTLAGFQMASTFSNTAPGSVSTTKTIQPEGGSTLDASTVSDGGVSNAMGTYAGALVPVSGVGTFLVTDTSSLQAQTGSVTQAGFVNSFVLDPTTSTADPAAVPESTSLALVGSALIFLSLISSSTRQRKRAQVR